MQGMTFKCQEGCEGRIRIDDEKAVLLKDSDGIDEFDELDNRYYPCDSCGRLHKLFVAYIAKPTNSKGKKVFLIKDKLIYKE